MGTPRMASTKMMEMMLAARFLTTLSRPKIRPRMQAKNNPHRASSRVWPMAASSRPP